MSEGAKGQSNTAGEKAFELQAVPPELVEIFITEANEHFERINLALGELDKNHKSKEHLQEVRRSVHTIKGAAGIAGFQSISAMMHRIEDLLDRLYEGTVEYSPYAVTLLYTTLDMLEGMTNGRKAPENSETALEELHKLYDDLLEPDAGKRTENSSEVLVEKGEFHILSREVRETTTQDKLMGLGMVPLSALVTRLNRIVRVMADQQAKLVDFVVEGEGVELNKTMPEKMLGPLLHILRNAVDHGIEFPGLRKAAGKPEKGQIKLSVHYQGTQLVIEVSDDGVGLDPEVLRSTALERGFISESGSGDLSHQELYSLIFEPGFSTRREVNEFSGRGMGMDVVQSAIHKMNGTISVSSIPGKGLTLTIRIPLH